jgi:thioredoxin reductase (NADPH)
VLVEQGDNAVLFFVVVSGELEIVRSCIATRTLVSMHVLVSLQEVNMISGRQTLIHIRATKPSKVIELNCQNMMALIHSNAELGEIIM